MNPTRETYKKTTTPAGFHWVTQQRGMATGNNGQHHVCIMSGRLGNAFVDFQLPSSALCIGLFP